MNPIFEQMIYYMIVMILGWLFVGFIQRGFFLRYLRVKLSFGRLIMVKIKSVTRDYFRVGHIEEGFLVYKGIHGHKRLSIKDKDVFYRVMGTIWVDVDEETNALMKSDYSSVTGFDAERKDNLYKRALYKPAIADTKEKIILCAVVIAIIASALTLILVWQLTTKFDGLVQLVNSLKETSIQPGRI